MNNNLHVKTVQGFGDEWSRYTQESLSEAELQETFDRYFRVFPWKELPADAIGFDMGCGSGRWAKLAAPRVQQLCCIDASPDALKVAETNLSELQNCKFLLGTFDNIPLHDNSMDFGYCLGVLHHIPDPLAGLKACVRKLKAGAPMLLYIYYAFDNRPMWFRLLWRMSDVVRTLISRAPVRLRHLITLPIALFIYFPLARIALLLEKLNINVDSFPLSIYRHHSFYTMKTDALDRFGTQLEQRFTAAQIRQMMEKAGLTGIQFSESAPYWCSVGYKAADLK